MINKRFSLFVISIFLMIGVLFAQEMNDRFTYKIGEFEVSLLSEVQQKGATKILLGATPEMLQQCVPDGTFPNAVNAYLLRISGKNILVDTGYGKKLFDNLKSLGVTPEQIDVVLLTHMHGDHIGGMFRDGQLAFPNADIYLPQPEYDYWTDDKAMNSFPEDRRGGFKGAQKVIDAYKSKLRLFAPVRFDDNLPGILPGIHGIEAYGHTPGHTMYLLESNKDKLLIWGDLTHAMAIQMPYPQVAVTYDTDPSKAIVSRKKTLEYVSQHKIPVAGMHVAFPGSGKVTVASSGGYLFAPMK